MCGWCSLFLILCLQRDDGRVLVGEAAKRQADLNPQNTVWRESVPGTSFQRRSGAASDEDSSVQGGERDGQASVRSDGEGGGKEGVSGGSDKHAVEERKRGRGGVLRKSRQGEERRMEQRRCLFDCFCRARFWRFQLCPTKRGARQCKMRGEWLDWTFCAV